MSNFVAIDFETADHGRDSACAVGVVKVSSGKIVEVSHHLIRPPRPIFVFSHLHGITWERVKDEPDFGEVWLQVAGLIEPSDLLLAHNASFDRSVLAQCCDAHDIDVPSNEFVCTVKVARAVWNIRPTNLANVSHHLQIDLQHHHAESDALACAKIGLAALAMGNDLLDTTRRTPKRKGSDLLPDFHTSTD